MNKGLGRGLSSLIPPRQNGFAVEAEVRATTPELQQSSNTTIMEIPVAQIEPNSMQPRHQFDLKPLQELADSIAEYGLLEPVIVTHGGAKQYQLVAGERRLRAFQLLNKVTIPAILRTTSELERLELALIENIQRQDLNPMERADSFSKLVHEFGLTQEEAAKKVGIARSTFANILRLLDLPVEVQRGLADGKITEGHAKVILGAPTAASRVQLYQEMTSGSAMSVRDLEDHVSTKKDARTKRGIFDYELQAVQTRLQSALGTKVTIRRKASGAKQIVIDTFSDEEFKSVIKKIA